MKIKEKTKIENKWILPDQTMTEDEFLAGIKKAEESDFMTIQESMQKFEEWIISRERT